MSSLPRHLEALQEDTLQTDHNTVLSSSITPDSSGLSLLGSMVIFGHGLLYSLLVAPLFRHLLPAILLSLLSLPVPVVLFDLPFPPSLSLVLSFAQSFERVRWFQRFQFL